MSPAISEAKAVAVKIHEYAKGCQTGDGSHFKAAFHPDARMFGAEGAERFDIPIFGGMDTAVADQPAPDLEFQILSIDIEGDAACVKVAESHFWGQDFVDFFILNRIAGEWEIVGKSFTHTGASA